MHSYPLFYIINFVTSLSHFFGFLLAFHAQNDFVTTVFQFEAMLPFDCNLNKIVIERRFLGICQDWMASRKQWAIWRNVLPPHHHQPLPSISSGWLKISTSAWVDAKTCILRTRWDEGPQFIICRRKSTNYTRMHVVFRGVRYTGPTD
jgi:hypothetical protein